MKIRNDNFEICPTCNRKKLKKISGDFILSKNVTIPGIEYYLCENCGEKLTNADNEEKIEHYLKKQSGKTKKAA